MRVACAWVHVRGLRVAGTVEGAEFTLLPSLLTSGALCRLTHLHIEWHAPALAAASQQQLEAGIGLRLSLQAMLDNGCGLSEGNETSILVDHEESTGVGAARVLAARAVEGAFSLRTSS